MLYSRDFWESILFEEIYENLQMNKEKENERNNILKSLNSVV